MPKIQIQSGKHDNDALLAQGGIEQPLAGWYTVEYSGDLAQHWEVQAAYRNPDGKVLPWISMHYHDNKC